MKRHFHNFVDLHLWFKDQSHGSLLLASFSCLRTMALRVPCSATPTQYLSPRFVVFEQLLFIVHEAKCLEYLFSSGEPGILGQH